MPTYEYECDQCDHAFEAFQRISDEPIRVCPECGKRKVRRLISSGGGIVFKGPGFYATDYRKTPQADTSSKSDSSKSDSSKSDSSAGDASGADSKPKKTGSDD
ncbi:MAG: zinc ribbon domain-containing protein [Gemmatimonadota bacterium]